jgi:hypothetical protein
MGEMINTHKIILGKPEGKTPLGRPRHRWEGNIRMDFREGLEGVYWICMAQVKDQCWTLVNTIMNLRLP